MQRYKYSFYYYVDTKNGKENRRGQGVCYIKADIRIHTHLVQIWDVHENKPICVPSKYLKLVEYSTEREFKLAA